MVNEALRRGGAAGEAAPALGEAQIRRYARHIVLPEIGGIGQARLLGSAVLVIGAGGLGSPLLLYLAAAGVGRIGVVDDDVVDASNLQRQVVHGLADLGRPKVESAADRLAGLSPDAEVVSHPLRLDASSAEALVGGYDVVADGSDNLATRLAVHDACRRVGRTLVSASVQGTYGQLSTFKSHLGPPHPCLRCLYPEDPAERQLPSCSQAGVLGPVAGVLGCLQAVETIKELTGAGQSLSGTLLFYDAMTTGFDRLAISRRAGCSCG